MDEKKEKYQIDIETAEDEFQRFCDAWEIDIDESSLNEDEKLDIQKFKRQIIKSIRLGRLCFNSDESLTYTFSEKSVRQSGQNIIIKRPKGAAYLGMDQFKDQASAHKTYSILAMMTGKAISFFADIDGIDLKPLQAIMTLFLSE